MTTTAHIEYLYRHIYAVGYLVVGNSILNARNLFQNGSFGDMCSFPTYLNKYSFSVKSVLLLTAVPIALKLCYCTFLKYKKYFVNLLRLKTVPL